MFDNSRKLNQIVGGWRGRGVSTLTNLPSDSVLQVCAQKVKEAIYELEFPTPASPECSLSLIERATNYAAELATVFLPYVGGEVGGDHAKVIKAADGLSQSLSDILTNAKGATSLVSDDSSEKLVSVAKNAGDVCLRLPPAPILRTRPAPVTGEKTGCREKQRRSPRCPAPIVGVGQ